MSAFLQKAQLDNLVAMDEADAEVVAVLISKWMSLQITTGIVMALIAIFLLVGGIMLLKRRKVSVMILRLWAVVYLLASTFFAIKSFPVQMQMVEILMVPA